jgi:hypothetical protein
MELRLWQHRCKMVYETENEIITNSKYNVHTENWFKNLEILSLRTFCHYLKFQTMYQFINNELPISFADILSINRNRNEDNISKEFWNAGDLHVPYARLSIIEKSPPTYFPKLWHDFHDILIKTSANKSTFKIQLKSHYLLSLKANYVCKRLLSPSTSSVPFHSAGTIIGETIFPLYCI